MLLLRFLRLFPQFRSLESRCAALEQSECRAEEELSAANAQLQIWQDRVEQSDRQVVFLRGEMTTAVAKERYTYQSWLNFQIQPQFGTAPFPEAATIPQDARFSEPHEAGPGGRQVMSPTGAQAAHMARFRQKSAEKLGMAG